MKKTITTSIVILVLLFTLGPVAAEEMAKEGSDTGKSYYTGTYKVIPMGEDRAQVSYEGFGVSVSDTGEGLLHNASSHCMGGYHAVKGVFEDDSGFCVFTRPDGDQIFATYKASGQYMKPVKATSTYVGGTGKFVGIQGSGTFTRYPLRPPAKGHFASLNIGKSHWKLPETKKK